MDRVFTEKVGRYEPGDRRDFPRGNWKALAESIGKTMEEISTPVEEVVTVGAKEIALTAMKKKVSGAKSPSKTSTKKTRAKR
jgi:hypothetical protein